MRAAGKIAVAAPHSAAVAAAEAVVDQGGGAIDAVIAAAAALTVVYPHQCSLGGDLVALVRTPDGKITSVLSIGAAPAVIDVAALRAQGPRMPGGGPLTVTVPGIVAGWAAIAELGARLDLSALFAPAIELAQNGTKISPGLARAIESRREVIAADPGLSALLLDTDQTPLPAGKLLRQPALAETLTALGKDWTSFYSGPIAATLLSGLAHLGSPLMAADFAAHAAELTDPLTRTQDGVTWSVAPPPTQGAAFLATHLSALARERPQPDEIGTFSRKTAEVESAWRAAGMRDALLGDPRGGPIDLPSLLGEGVESVVGMPPGPKPAGDTVAVTVVGEDGTAISLIQSVYQSFGSGMLEPNTGIVLHNRGSAFSLDESHPGRLQPGIRPPHTLCPVLASDAESVLALGCQGGRAQPWILAQLASDAFSTDDLEAVVARPRWVIGSRDLGLTNPGLVLEPGLGDDLVPPAARLGLDVHHKPELHDEAGHVQVARLRTDKQGRVELDAASDIRADGVAALL